MKRVLIFSLAYYPHVGGAEVAVKEITDRIQDIEFHMVTLRWSSEELPEEKIGDIHVFRISCGPGRIGKALFQFGAFWKALSLQRQYSYSGIWALMAHSAGVPAALFKIAYPHVPYILNLQEGDPTDQIERTMVPLWPLFVRAFRSADIVQSLSTSLAAWARKMGFRGRIEIIPNGVDVSRFEGDSVAHSGVVLITTSRLVHKNATDDVIRALRLLPPSVHFQILGIGPDEAMLKKLAESLGVAKRVTFVGHIDHAAMPAYLHKADIFIRPSRSEGQGASFMEAMGAGLPVVATQEGGIADFLFDAHRNPDTATTGWAVDKNSPEQIAAAVKDILAHPEKVAQVTQTAKNLVVARYDWDFIAKEMHEKVFVLL